MSFKVIILSFSALTVSAAGFSQARVDVSFAKEKIETVIEHLSKTTDCRFIYRAGLFGSAVVTDIQLKNATVPEVLEKVLTPHGFDYEITDNVVVVKRSTNVQQPATPTRVVFAGRVVDQSGDPLVGVTVVVDGTTIGTTTDANGRFSLNVSDQEITIIFSYIGLESQKLPLHKLAAGQTHSVANIVMRPSDVQVQDVVVTGIFNRNKESFTGSAQTFNRQELRRVGNSNVLQSIRNLDPSFRITESLIDGSDPNKKYEITLRGQSGFPDLKEEYTSNPNEPLFIVDGFEQSLTSVMDMNMDRVASVTLLKDAAAKAIYGAKAANGVVVIETVLPEKGQLRVTYTGSLDIQLPDLTSYNLCNAAEKLEVENNASMFTYFNDNGVDITTSFPNQYTWDQTYNFLLGEVLAGVNTDWKSIPLRNGVGQKHGIFLEGGDDYFRYGLDFSYNNIEGVMKGSSRNTYSGGITLSYRYKDITLRNSFTAIYNKGINSPYGEFNEYTRMNPYYRHLDENGNVIKIPGESFAIMYSGRGDVYNPAYNATINTKNFTEYTQLVENFYLDWTPFAGFKLTGRLSLNKTDSGAEKFWPAAHTSFVGWEDDEEKIHRRGSYTYTDGKALSFSTDVLANYSMQLGEHHTIYANAGWSTSNASSESAIFIAEGFPSEKLDNLAFARQYFKDGRPKTTESTTRDVGFVSAVNYAFMNRYLFDASFRLSGSSQFGSQNRWGKFWSLGLGWNIHDEQFMSSIRDAGIIDRLKLRASLGYTGSQNFSSYQAQATYTYYTKTAYMGNVGAVLTAMPNDRLRWQRKFDKNIGLDIASLDQALNVRLDYYQSNTDDLLTDVSIPSSTGFLFYKENLGKVENKGYEFNVRYRVWQDKGSGSFLNLFAGGSHNKNRIKKISNSLQTFNDSQTVDENTKPITRFAEGQPMTAIWAVPSYGIDPASGKELFIKPDGTRTYKWDADYLAICGDMEPTLMGNFGFNFDYKGISVNVTARYQFGGQVYNQTLVDKVENADLNYNVDRRIHTDRWVKKGDVSLYKDIRNASVTRATSRFVEDDDQLFIAALNVSYELTRIPAIKRSNLDRLKLSFDMSDFGRIQSVRIERGTAYPFARSFSVSLQAMF